MSARDSSTETAAGDSPPGIGNDVETLQRENRELRERLSRLSDASLRINERLEDEQVLQVVLDAARSLADARYGVITLLDEQGQLQRFLASGLSTEQSHALRSLPEGWELFDHLASLRQPLRLSDLTSYVASLGLVDFELPFPTGAATSFLGVAIRHRGEHVGNFFLAMKEQDEAFTVEDEEVLVMFASQAALVVANARRFRDEQRARADLETLIETSPVGVAVFDGHSGEPVSYNPEAARIVNNLLEQDQDPAELLRVATLSRADGRRYDLGQLSMTQALEEVTRVRSEEMVLTVPDGRSVSALVNATPIRSAGGSIESLVVTIQDLSALEEADRLRSNFMGLVSHELRTPLASIKGAAATLLDARASLDPAEMQLFFRIIDQHADRMSDLITDLLDMARIDSGTLAVAPEASVVEVLIEQAEAGYRDSGGRHAIEMDVEPDLPSVMADRRRIAQVLDHLLAQAERDSIEPGTIQLSASLQGSHVAFTVADSDHGASQEMDANPLRKPGLAQMGERAEARDGSGLALAICKGIVEAHGGRIRTERDRPGAGSRVTFTLPVAADPARAGARTPGPARPESQSRAVQRTRVLVVDDDPLTLRYVRGVLSEAGFDVSVTGDPEQVAALLAGEQPDLVLLDLVLPGTDGIDLMQLLPELSKTPVIFISAYGRDQNVARALQAGAVDYVVKPFSPTELLARIETALRKRHWTDWDEPSEPYRHGGLVIEYPERRVTVDGREATLTDLEYRVLYELSIHPGRVLTNQQLLERVWGESGDVGFGPLRTVIKNLRRKLGDSAEHPRYVFTEPRAGYRMTRTAAEHAQQTTEAGEPAPPLS